MRQHYINSAIIAVLIVVLLYLFVIPKSSIVKSPCKKHVRWADPIAEYQEIPARNV